jgi:hypothetical protein
MLLMTRLGNPFAGEEKKDQVLRLNVFHIPPLRSAANITVDASGGNKDGAIARALMFCITGESAAQQAP